MQKLLSETRSSNGLSHSIFQLFPRDDKRILGQARIEAVSRWALDVFLDEYETRRQADAFIFYTSLANSPDTGSLRGQIFERQILKYFDGLKEPYEFRIRSLADSTVS
jgi:hypothetical protein